LVVLCGFAWSGDQQTEGSNCKFEPAREVFFCGCLAKQVARARTTKMIAKTEAYLIEKY
jgi:hypothetical protein